MTTIAYRDGVLAGDTRATDGNTKLPVACRKVWKLRNGCLFGAAGLNEGIKMLKNSLDGSDTPKLKGVNAIIVRPNGDILTYEGELWGKENAPYVALGSGRDFSLAAMWMGAHAIKAVKAGIHFDKNSGGRVLSVCLNKEIK